MKILLTIHHELNPNLGAPGVTWRLGQEYLKLGHEVSFFSFDDLPSFLPPLVKSILFPEFVAQKVASLVNLGKIDVVDASTGDGWLWGKLSKSFHKKTPLLVTRSHGLEHTVHLQLLEEVKRGNMKISWKYPIYHGGFHLREVSSSMRLADLVLLLNKHDLEYSVNELKVKRENTFIVKNGILDNLLNLPLPPDLKDDKFRIALIGSYIPRKGTHYSVPALQKILRDYPNVEVTFLGSMIEKEQILTDFDHDLGDRIHVIPRYQNGDLASLLLGHAIHLFPSLSEGFGLAVVEAMACGLVPIVTDIPGPTEIVTHDFDSIIIPPRDSLAIKEALRKLITNQEYLSKLRLNAYQTAQKYSWTNIAKDNFRLYEEALSR
ncbi:glycosyltransferase family 4 protein [Pseudanabaena sp. FACHB-1998]|uniref:glycosyltransferase family 4 protein n=1 Tax=Pseudanabaena sp. FACHB-1998 TaxID=2692858 RepID=UPI001680F1C9|nr:glycosyltransferase family 4 protein [Pseudanabaena sp. FACHB-1998]MBD2178192.1 glycosyltransferase family 4 protein [Pseudanabaena sp. FACHB-1998]